MVAQLLRRPDAAFASGAWSIRTGGLFGFFESPPDVGPPRRVFAETVVMAERITEEAKTIQAAAAGFGQVAMHGETRHHADVGIHGMADRHAFFLEDTIVVVHPLLGLRGIDECERQG